MARSRHHVVYSILLVVFGAIFFLSYAAWKSQATVIDIGGASSAATILIMLLSFASIIKLAYLIIAS